MKFVVIFFIPIVFQKDSSLIIYDFKKEKNNYNWYIVNDDVMGGLSKAEFKLNENDIAIFKGYVSTENNGGFCSIRHRFKLKNVSTYSHVVIKVKGDRKYYQLRIKEKSNQRFSYITNFETTGAWEIIKIPFESFYPSYRGYKLDMPNYSGDLMQEITILIGNKKKEAFELHIESIKLE